MSEYDMPCEHGALMSFKASGLPDPLPRGTRVVVEIPAVEEFEEDAP